MLSRIFLLWLSLLSHYRQHKTQGLFLVAGLTLGVAMFLATVLISGAAQYAFQQAQQSVSGAIIAEIKPVDGRTYFSEALYRRLKFAGVEHISPVIEGVVTTEQGNLLLQGADIFPLLNRQGQTSGQGMQSDKATAGNRVALFQEVLRKRLTDHSGNPLFRFMFPPYLALVSESWAKMHGVHDGQQITTAAGVLPEIAIVSDDLGIGYSIFCDLRCAQAALGATNQLTSIRFSALAEEDIPAIETLLGEQAQLVLADKPLGNPAFTDAFLLNLKGIGFLAFLVGCFIAFNAAKFSVIQRQKMVRQLRLCGASAREVLLAFLLELTSWALVASISGCALGWMIASTLLPMIGLTLNQLFYSENTLALSNIWQGWGVALVIAVLAALTSTARPFWVLAKQQPFAESVEPPTQNTPRLVHALLLAVTGVLLWILPVSRSQELGLVIAACWFLSGALLVPVLLAGVYRCGIRLPCLHRFPVLHWAIAGGERDQQRTSVAMMAYSISLAASIAVMTMVVSFEQVFTDYLDDVLSGSLYLRLNKALVNEVENYLLQDEAVALSYRFYQQPALMGAEKGFVRGLSDYPLRHHSVSTETVPEGLWRHFHDRQGVLINQALALSQQLHPGDHIALEINRQRLTTQVLAVYYSYGSLAPGVVMDQQWLLSVWPALESYRIGVFLKDDQQLEAFTGRLITKFSLHSGQYIRPHQLKEMAQKIFRQTFYATRILATAILFIAAIGIFCSCYTSQLANARQLALIHILGVGRLKALLVTLGQLAVNVTLSSFLALPLGLLVALASVQIVLRFSFGWYFPLFIDWHGIFSIMVIGLMATLLGSIVPLILARRKTTIQELV